MKHEPYTETIEGMKDINWQEEIEGWWKNQSSFESQVKLIMLYL